MLICILAVFLVFQWFGSDLPIWLFRTYFYRRILKVVDFRELEELKNIILAEINNGTSQMLRKILSKQPKFTSTLVAPIGWTYFSKDN